MGKPESPRSRRQILAIEREQRAVELRIAGKSFAEIASDLGVTKQAVSKSLDRAIAHSFDSEERQKLRSVQLLRLERLHAAVWPKALEGESDAISSVLKVMERLAKLCGLDQPTATRIFIGDSDIDDAINRKLAIVAGGSETPLLPPSLRARDGDPPGGDNEAGPIVDSPPANGETEIVSDPDLQ